MALANASYFVFGLKLLQIDSLQMEIKTVAQSCDTP